MKETVITKNEEGYKLKKVCARYLKEAPVSFIYKMLRKKNIVLNDKKATGDEVLKQGDVIKYYLSDETIEKFGGIQKTSSGNTSYVSHQTPSDNSKKKSISVSSELDVIYEDEDVIFVYKEVGVLSQKAKDSDYSINEMIIDYLLKKGDISKDSMRMFRPSVCNRLDRNTSGLIMASKSPAGARALTYVIRDRSVKKYYKAVVPGCVRLKGRYKAYLTKNEKTNKVRISDKPVEGASLIETSINVSDYNKERDLTLLDIELITGKSHQIRAHLAFLGYPIVGDTKYGETIKIINSAFYNKYGIKSQMLTAYRVVFPEYADGEDAVLNRLSGKEFSCRLPKEFKKFF